MYISSGMTEKQILEDFQDLPHEDLIACLSYTPERMK